MFRGTEVQYFVYSSQHTLHKMLVSQEGEKVLLKLWETCFSWNKFSMVIGQHPSLFFLSSFLLKRAMNRRSLSGKKSRALPHLLFGQSYQKYRVIFLLQSLPTACKN